MAELGIARSSADADTSGAILTAAKKPKTKAKKPHGGRPRPEESKAE
jgi:hypothetical protein